MDDESAFTDEDEDVTEDIKQLTEEMDVSE